MKQDTKPLRNPNIMKNGFLIPETNEWYATYEEAYKAVQHGQCIIPKSR